MKLAWYANAAAGRQAASSALSPCQWPWSSRLLRSLGLATVFLLGPLAFMLVILLLIQGRGGRFFALRGGASAEHTPASACMYNGSGNTHQERPVDPSILARRAEFLPPCEASGLPGTGWGQMVFRDLPGGGMKHARTVTVSPPKQGFRTDYVTGGPPLSAVLKGVCIEKRRPTFRYVFVGRNESWLDEDPELKLAGPVWEDVYEKSYTPVLHFSPSAKALSQRSVHWVPGVTMRVRVRSPNPNHHMMENVLHESAVQVLQEEYEEKLGGRIEHFLADVHFNRAMGAEYALAAHLTRVTLSLTPEADLIMLEANSVTCFETLVVNQMWIWPLRHLNPRARMYTEDQVGRALAAYRDATWAYLKVTPPRVSRPRQGEEVRLGVYARKHMWHRKIVNMDEVAAGVVAAIRDAGAPNIHVTNIDALEGAHLACPLDPKKNPEFRDQILAIANLDVYVGAHGGHGALSVFLPRCAAFLEIDSECGKGHWSPAETYATAIGFRADWQRGNNTLVTVSLVPKDYSMKFGFPAGSNVSTDCAGLRGIIGYVGYTYSPDFAVAAKDVSAWAKNVVKDWLDDTKQGWLRSYCEGEGKGGAPSST